MKKKYIILLVLSGLAVFVVVKYFNYRKSVDSVKNFRHGAIGVVEDINSYIRYRYENDGILPNKEELSKYLKSLDSEFLSSEEDYSLEIDTSKNHIKLYAFGRNGIDNNLSNIIDARQYSSGESDPLQDFDFFSYLFSGDYDILLFDESVN